MSAPAPAGGSRHSAARSLVPGRRNEQRLTEPTSPKSLADPGEVARRCAMVGLPHLARLAPLLTDLRGAYGEVPDPDPLDGGAEARLLLLLETPSPRIRCTGFVSRDNPAETAANLFRFLREAGIARSDTLIWNAVPWG